MYRTRRESERSGASPSQHRPILAYRQAEFVGLVSARADRKDEGKLALGVSSVRVFSTHSQHELVETLRERGYGVTEQDGRGREGPVAILHAVVRRRDVRDVTRTVEHYDPDAFVTIQNDAVVHRGWMYAVKRR